MRDANLTQAIAIPAGAGYEVVMARVLVIEDDADSRDLLVMLLDAGGYAVTSTESESTALRALHVGSYDVVLADLMLARPSVTSSWEYIDHVVDVADPAPVGLLSGWQVLEHDAAAHRLAFVLRKPCTRDDLFTQLATTLRLPPLSPSEIALLNEYFRCTESGDYECFRSILAPDFTYRLPGSDPRFSNEVRGIDSFIEFTARTFEAFLAPRFELGSIRPLPRGAMVEYVGSWQEGTSRRSMPGAAMFALAGGRIQRAELRVNVDELH